MLLAVLDVGSNSAHLQIVEAHETRPPRPVYRLKAPTLLAESVTPDGALTADGVERVISAVASTIEASRRHPVADLIPLATATIRDATNNAEIRRRVHEATGVELRSLSGEDEARVTYLAVRRWLTRSDSAAADDSLSPPPSPSQPAGGVSGVVAGSCGSLVGSVGGVSGVVEGSCGSSVGSVGGASGGSMRAAGSMLLLDIGGMSMEVAGGHGETPEFAVSLPLGAGLLTRRFLPHHPADRDAVEVVRRHVRAAVRPVADRLAGLPRAEQVIGTSKTFKQLIRLTGDRDRLTQRSLRHWVPRLAAMTAQQRAKLPGVAASRARQILAGAITAATVMEILDVPALDVCPWALREGLLLRRFTELSR